MDEGSEKINSIRVGIIKAVINRNSKKEELKMGLDRENENQDICVEECLRLWKKFNKTLQEEN